MIAVITGLTAGIIHVWTGPDHLATIAPLAVRSPKRSWIPGFRWGLGHSAGVVLIGLLSLLLRGLIPINLVTTWGQRTVGVVLIAIGFWALAKALRVHVHEHEHDGERHLHVHAHTHRIPHTTPEAHHHHTHAAFGIGILHGLAGSSHFLGVLPILVMPGRAMAIEYLGAFAVGTIASMAGFSWLMGSLASRCAHSSSRVYRGLMSVCAATAILLGGFWLTQ